MQFKNGDLVRLKSGGPVMTVQFIRDGYAQDAECAWFICKTNKLASFAHDSLEKYESVEPNTKLNTTSVASIVY